MLIVLVLSEPVMTLIHRWLFHGPLWCMHRSHHEFPASRKLVKNDLLWLSYFVFATAIFLLSVFYFDQLGGQILTGVSSGAALYGAAYIFAHDGVAHGRFYVPRSIKRHSFFRRLTMAHGSHHRGGVQGPGSAPFGVYSGPFELAHHLNDGFFPDYRPC